MRLPIADYCHPPIIREPAPMLLRMGVSRYQSTLGYSHFSVCFRLRTDRTTAMEPPLWSQPGKATPASVTAWCVSTTISPRHIHYSRDTLLTTVIRSPHPL